MEDAGGQETLPEESVDKKGLRESPSNAPTQTARYEANNSEYSTQGK